MALRSVLDASVLVPLFAADALSGRTEAWLSDHEAGLVVSDFALAEVSSALARKVRTGRLSGEEAALAWDALDVWVAVAAERVTVTSADIAEAQRLIRLLEPPLRTPDAIHVALTWRLRGTLVTFDDGLARAARALSLPLSEA